jgi:hypothetical protein
MVLMVIKMALVVKIVAEVVMETTAIAMVIMMEVPYLQMNVKDKLIASKE